jgi:hypothetical protein
MDSINRNVTLGRSYRYRGWGLQVSDSGPAQRELICAFVHPGAENGVATRVLEAHTVDEVGYFNFDIYIPHIGTGLKVFLSCVSDIPAVTGTNDTETIGWSKQGWLDPIDVPVSYINSIQFSIYNSTLNEGTIDEFEYFAD